MKFTHLHVHSHYSLLDGLPKIDELLDCVKKLGMDAVALTDHGVIYGGVEFYKKAKAKGIKPIIGCEVYVAYESMHQERPNIDDKRYHLVLLVKNEVGYKNLVKLLTKAHLEGFYYKPRVDHELLAQHADGLIALSACVQGKIPRKIIAGKMEEAEETAAFYQKIFGPDNFYLEIQKHSGIPEQQKVNQALIAFSQKLNIPLVATNDCHYLKTEDAEAQDILMLINTGSEPNDPERLTMKEDDFSMRTPERMLEDFKENPEALENTQKIVDLCQFEFELGKTKLPVFPVPDNKSADDYLKELCYQRLETRYPDKPPAVLERLGYELDAIKKTGFASYFLIVQDFVNWAKSHRIIVGPGRGSCAGSLAAYVLNITNVDPLKYNLLFERFLNPERISLPDIDLDFTDRRRDEVIKYVAEKYGADHVSQIITFGTMAARAVIRDVGRALGYSYLECDVIAKMIPFGLTLDETLAGVDEFRKEYLENQRVQKLVDFAKKLEGCARHASTHACGVVISKESLSNIVPLQHPTQDDQAIVTQYEMHSIEDLGLLKMDFLGLKNLTIIEDTLARIYKVQGKSIDIEKIPLDDKATFRLFQKAETTSVFQLESDGMKRYLKELKPTELEDIIAMVALYRPGPMQFIPEYIEGKQGKRQIEYLHQKLEPILKNTYGVCVSGDSLIQTANPGGICQIDQIINSSGKLSVQSLNLGKNVFEKKYIKHKFNNGIKNVYQIKLRTGKEVKATLEHQFLTPEGWRKTKELKSGDFLATPKKLFSGENDFDKNKLKVLAYLIADGALSNKVDCYFINKNQILINDFKKCAEKGFKNLKITITTHARKVQRANPSKIDRSNYHQPNNLLAWLRELHLKTKLGGRKSNDKFVPPFIFGLKKKYYSTFLAALWDCDGGITLKSAYLTTISKKLAYDVQSLFLKLGINGHVYKLNKYKSRNAETMQVYRVIVYDLLAFKKSIADFMVSRKKTILAKIVNNFECDDFVPRKYFMQKINDYLKVNKLSQKAFCRRYKVDHNLFRSTSKNRNRLHLRVAKKLSNILQDSNLTKIANDKSIRWDDIVAITKRGKENVYDIEVDTEHNYIVNNIISHNCVYQEQVMQIARDLAGFSLSEADVLRKAIGKKIKELLMAQKEKFIEGAKKNYIEGSIAARIWHWFEPFAQYSFNKSHAACYALIAYQTAYLKAHYPVEFMASVLTSEKADVERIGFLIQECKKMGLEVLAPNINESLANFTVVPPKQIRFGLLAIKNVGNNVVETIVSQRKEAGPFKSIFDFVSRVNSRDLNKKSLESLIKAGAFDKLAERNQLLQNLEKLLESARENQRNKANGQKGLFDSSASTEQVIYSLKLNPTAAASKSEKLAWEKELLGLFVSSHPLQDYQEILGKKSLGIVKAKSNSFLKKIVCLGGIVSSIKKIVTKTGRPMLFMGLEDLQDKIEVVVFPGAIERNPAAFQENKIVFVQGRMDNRDGVPKLICDSIEEVVES